MEAIALAPEIPITIPPLADGDHLTRAEFERRYDTMPHIKKAELIEGIVQEKQLRWWFLDENDTFAEIEPDPSDGLLHSRVFEGLKLDHEALIAGDLQKEIISVFS